MERPLRVLLVEDSEDDAVLLLRQLRKGGYTPEYERVDTRESMQMALKRRDWDVVITDHNMPSFSSADALSIVKDSGHDLPIIIVSGSIGEDIAVSSMKAGAHDYIMKGNLARLVPAIERELREAENRRAHRRAEETIRHMAYHDSLTGLINRHQFEQRVREALRMAKDHGYAHVLLYLDLDQFKVINDTCGHMAGDELLRQLAVVMRSHVRETDTLARLGGDEFGMLLEKCGPDDGQRIAETLLQIIRDFRFVWRDKTFDVGGSIGLVTLDGHSGSVSDVLSAADLACYAAKDHGRNRVHIYNEQDSDLARRHGEMQWVSRIKQALDEERFMLYRQCIVALKEGGKQHCELLIRMRGSDGAVIAPGAFIPAAERYNLMPSIDRWVIDTAFSHIATLYEQQKISNGGGAFFINLSGASLSDDSLFDYIQEQLRGRRLPGHLVCFEVTETAAISNMSSAVELIEKLKGEGCQFALDDFGAGLSSFSYLKSMEVNYLKIDGGFITDMLDDDMDCAIVKAINDIGHQAKLETIAEFVENDATKQRLIEIGVDYAQGYGIEVPAPITD